MSAADLASGKGHRDENFPVASFMLRPEHRAPILTFYRFARIADDVADHPATSSAEKLALLETMRATLVGESDVNPEALALRRVLADHGLGPRHPLDLLEAFRRDAVQGRYHDWDALIEYCRFSAMPVGRYVLDVHGESENSWPASDALCAALQIINHLQDCAKDYRDLDRVYIPTEELAAAGADVAALGAARASPALRGVIVDLANRTGDLLARSVAFGDQLRSRRLGFEVAVIQRLAESLVGKLRHRDPLAERVHHRLPEVLGLAALAASDRIFGR